MDTGGAKWMAFRGARFGMRSARWHARCEAHLAMRYLALALDFDGTIAEHGRVDPSVLAGLKRAKDGTRRLVLVTGRIWSDLREVFPEYRVFDRIVVENGAVLVDPENGREELLASAPPAAFVQALTSRAITPLSLGKVIAATWEPNQHEVLSIIQELGLELQVIFNKGAVMVLPSGINKATGLAAALAHFGISAHNCIAAGDAENDHALLEHSGLGVAVSNAVPMLKERADWVTREPRGFGVLEVIDEWIATGLDGRRPRGAPPLLSFGKESDGSVCGVDIHRSNVLLCGSSGGGKSTLASALLEQLGEKGYQYCLIDPEGDFEASTGRVVMGDASHAPEPTDVVKALSVVAPNVVVNLLGVPLEQRPHFSRLLLEQLKAHQVQFGRPHWIVIDEAHHMLSKDVEVDADALHDPWSSLLLITVHPGSLHPSELTRVHTVVVVGDHPRENFAELAALYPPGLPSVPSRTVEPGMGMVWSRQRPDEIRVITTKKAREERRRHHRKYAVGELGEDKSFYFRGPEGALNLRAHNLHLFMQMAEGVDSDTWSYHLKRNDYSRWLRDAVKDGDLASEVLDIERAAEPVEASRANLRRAIERRYTLPA